MKILVTGAKGFIGRNFCSVVENSDLGIELIRYDINDRLADLEKGLAEADAVVHLAGVNRPENNAEFFAGNTDFTKRIIRCLNKLGRRVPIVMSSSIQAELDNAYGMSKLHAEEAVFNYERSKKITCFVFRLPNVFGKWARPNYNSVVATWCHNITRDLPISIDNPQTTIELVYVSDVVASFIQALTKGYHKDEHGFCHVAESYRISLGDLSDKLFTFKGSRSSLVVPNFLYRLDSLLYATYLSYLPEDDFGYELDTKRDDRGWLAEFIKSEHSGQVFVSLTKPGITRGNHWHQVKVEKFLVIAGDAKICFRCIDKDEVIEYFVSGDKLTVLDIPVGYTHSIENTGDTDVLTLFWSNEIFDANNADTEFLEVYIEN